MKDEEVDNISRNRCLPMYFAEDKSTSQKTVMNAHLGKTVMMDDVYQVLSKLLERTAQASLELGRNYIEV